VIVWTHDRWRFPLPEHHRFPIDKYTLLRERVEADGLEVRDAEPVPWEWLEAVHEPALVERIRTGALSMREQRGLGLPWSEALVERGRRSVGGTVAAARLALERGLGMNLGGGTHHAGRSFARGYCLFNDVAVALARMRAEGRVRRALVVDCDVHQGDGTADLLADDSECFTLSLHGARNYPWKSVSSSVLASSDVGRRIPSDLDVDLESGTGDEQYLAALTEALDNAVPRADAELAFYLAGADPWHGDRLGRLALTKDGLRARDELVLDRLGDVPVCVVLAGGYAEDVRDTVDIHAATVAVVTRRWQDRADLPITRR
jgi:acetoin utilization deacetylase AcuC-like enzyme